MKDIKEQVLLSLSKLFEIPVKDLTGLESLDDPKGVISWTSIEVIGFIAMCDEQFDIFVSTSEIMKAECISDLITLVKNKVVEKTVA